MPEAQARDVTGLLRAWSAGEEGAFDRLIPLVYGELRRLAHRHLLGERPGHSVQTTTLVHEAYLRLAGANSDNLRTRGQFFAVAGQIMRHLLVDAARKRLAAKRGGGAPHVPLDGVVVATSPSNDLVALDQALKALGQIEERKMRVVELRYFAGLTVEETAEVLDVSPDTVMRDWKFAKLWLSRELRRGTSEGSGVH